MRAEMKGTDMAGCREKGRCLQVRGDGHLDGRGHWGMVCRYLPRRPLASASFSREGTSLRPGLCPLFASGPILQIHLE